MLREIPEGFKKCAKCMEIKPVTEFYVDSSKIDGRRRYCKHCSSQVGRASYRKNKEHVKEYQSKYRVEHKEHLDKYRENLYKNPYRIWAHATIQQHKKRGYDVRISDEILEGIARETRYCGYCMCKLNWSYGNKKYVQPNSPTLDRIYNEKEITVDNMKIVCHRCNTTKRELPLHDLYEYCCNVVRTLSPKFEGVEVVQAENTGRERGGE
jgi:hypothetical protein